MLCKELIFKCWKTQQHQQTLKLFLGQSCQFKRCKSRRSFKSKIKKLVREEHEINQFKNKLTNFLRNFQQRKVENLLFVRIKSVVNLCQGQISTRIFSKILDLQSDSVTQQHIYFNNFSVLVLTWVDPVLPPPAQLQQSTSSQVCLHLQHCQKQQSTLICWNLQVR